MLNRAGLSIIALAVLAPGCGELPDGPADTQQMAVRGVTIADWTSDGYASAQAQASVNEIAMLGANTLTILVTVYQDDVTSSDPAADVDLTPEETGVANLAVSARSLQMSVCLKIHVDVRSGEWRGKIRPLDPGVWFDNYRAIMNRWAALAEAFAVEQLVVGTELAGTLEHERQWRDLITAVRGQYSGELVYAASWDEARKVPFWDAVDLVGVNFYAPVAPRADTHRFEILREWQPWIGRLQLLHKLTDRDILLTEIGYRSIDGAGMHPYDFTSVGSLDLTEQADLYWAALQAVGDKPWIRGVYWWNWLANGSSEQEIKDFTPRGKPSAAELVESWR